MAAVLPLPSENARKSERLILQRLAAVGQDAVAAALGCDDSKVSRWKAELIQAFAVMLDVLGLKVVPKELKCYDEETLQAMVTLARQRMGQISSPAALVWDDNDGKAA